MSTSRVRALSRLSKLGTSQRSRLPAALVALALPVSLVATPFAIAHVTTPPFTIGPDGSAVVPGTGDHDQTLGDPEGNVKEPGPLNSNTTKIGVIHNDEVPTLGFTNPNGQVDLRQAWLGTKEAGGDDWVYFAWERDSSNGSGFIAYEFMQDPPPAACNFATGTTAELTENCNPWANRKAGDFMILWDQQGGSEDLFLRTWSGTAPNLVLSPPGTALDASVSSAAYSGDGLRGEAALNLTDTVFAGSTACRTFANIIPSTVTGNSDTADYKDTILQPVIPIGTCDPGISTQATGTAVLGSTISDTATISGGFFPSGGPAVGTVTFKLYGPFAADATITSTSCVDPASGVTDNLLFTSTVNTTRANDTTASATSGTYMPNAPGKYAWVASYSGNADNGPVSGTCGDANEASVITKAPASLTTAQSLHPQDSVTVTATVGGTPTGTVTFKLFGPGNATCDPNGAAPVYSEVDVALNGGGSAVTSNSTFSINAASSSQYKWLVSYSGDSNHLPITGSCGDENFTLTIDNGGTVSSP